MKICENGIYREATAEEIAELNSYTPDPIPYEQRVVSRIREVYSVDDELAILRQRESKPEEFSEYNAFVERIKAEERGEAG
jgi:hypothetical protein